MLLLVASYRSEDRETSPFVRALDGPEGRTDQAVQRRELLVEALTPAESRELALTLIGRAGPEALARAEEVARESGGNPFFVGELVRHVQAGEDPLGEHGAAAAVDLDDVLWARILRLPEEARRLLEVVAISGRPLREADACRCVEGLVDGRSALALLRSGRLVRGVSGTDEEIETYHDRIRETVVARLGPEALRGHHRRLALVLEASGRADPEVLGAHFRGAGEAEKAGSYFAAAAVRAADALAFDRAAKLYRLALEVPPADAGAVRQLRAALGDALANAGRGAEAARAYLEAAEGATVAEALELRRRAALQYLISGHIDEGLAALRSVLGAVGMRLPATPRGAFLSLPVAAGAALAPRARLPAARPQRDLRGRPDPHRRLLVGRDRPERRRLDPWGRLSVPLPPAGPPRRRALADRPLAGDGGGPQRDRRAALPPSYGQPAGGRRAARPAGRRCVPARHGRPGPAASQPTSKGTGRKPTSIAIGPATSSAIAVLASIGSGTPRSAFGLWALSHMGEFAELGRQWPRLLAEARDRGDLYAVMNLSTYLLSIVRLAADEPDLARDEVGQAMAHWSRGGYHVQHNDQAWGMAQIELYAGRGGAAWDLITWNWPALSRSLLLRVQFIRVAMWQLRGALRPGGGRGFHRARALAPNRRG